MTIVFFLLNLHTNLLDELSCLWHSASSHFTKKSKMAKRKSSKTQNDLGALKKELLHELHLFHIRISEELKKLSEAVSKLNNTLDRYHQEVRLAMKDSFDQVMHAIDTIGSEFDTSREELEGSKQN